MNHLVKKKGFLGVSRLRIVMLTYLSSDAPRIIFLDLAHPDFGFLLNDIKDFLSLHIDLNIIKKG